MVFIWKRFGIDVKVEAINKQHSLQTVCNPAVVSFGLTMPQQFVRSVNTQCVLELQGHLQMWSLPEILGMQKLNTFNFAKISADLQDFEWRSNLQ